MARISDKNIITAIDIGTTKICVLIAQSIDHNQFKILGIGKAPSNGLAKGVVVDVGKTVLAIQKAVKEAELMSTICVDEAFVGIAGSHIRSINSQGMIPLKRGVIRSSDIDQVLASAQAIPIPEGEQLLHALPQYFIIDGIKQIANPLGMHGVRLEAVVHLILGSVYSVHDIITCCQQAGITVHNIVLEPLASAAAVLSDDERSLGVGLLDIGGGTSDLAIYQNGTIRHTAVIPIAGNHITHDLAIGLRTTLCDAERIKKEYACAYSKLLDHNTYTHIDLVQGNDQQIVYTNEITNIIQPRMQELFELIKYEITQKKMHSYMTSGLVLTGGGSLLYGIRELAEDIFNVPVRIGKPQICNDSANSLVNPIYATGYGLILHALQKNNEPSLFKHTDGSLLIRIGQQMKSWLSNMF